MYRYFKRIGGVGAGDYFTSWKFKGLFGENITASSAPNNFLNSLLEYLGTKPRVRFSGSCLEKNAITYNDGKSVKIYIVYEINKNDNATSSDPKLENRLFRAVTSTKMSILTGGNILSMVLDLIEKEVFHFLELD